MGLKYQLSVELPSELRYNNIVSYFFFRQDNILKNKDYEILAMKIHRSLLEVQDMNGALRQIDRMLDDISRKIGIVDEVTWHELERRRKSNDKG